MFLGIIKVFKYPPPPPGPGDDNKAYKNKGME